MKTKTTPIYLAALALALVGGQPMTAVADKTVEMDLRFAGSFVGSGIKHLDLSTPGDPDDTTTSALIHVQAKGSPGRAELRGFGGGGDSDPEFTLNCLGSSGTFLSITATEDPLVFTFHKDLSLLFADGGGEVCIDLATGKSEFRFDIMFKGGRGRFEDATGYAVIEGEAEPVSADGSFLGETGTIVGWIILPDDDDDDDDDD